MRMNKVMSVQGSGEEGADIMEGIKVMLEEAIVLHYGVDGTQCTKARGLLTRCFRG